MENETKKTYADEKIIDTLIDSKISTCYSYENKEKNFTIPHELTVTITLKEYRELVEKVAKSKYEEEAAKLKIEKDIKEREERIKLLKEQLQTAQLKINQVIVNKSISMEGESL